MLHLKDFEVKDFEAGPVRKQWAHLVGGAASQRYSFSQSVWAHLKIASFPPLSGWFSSRRSRTKALRDGAPRLVENSSLAISSPARSSPPSSARAELSQPRRAAS